MKAKHISTYSLFFALFISIFLIIGCQQKSSSYQIRISTNPWIGFTPFIYAQEKGWLDGTKFKFLWTVGLGENATLYEKGLSDGFTATQYEYFNFRSKEHLKPFFLIDRSNGADVVMSNRTIEQLKAAKEPVESFFELITLNKDIFKAFTEKYAIDPSKFELHNTDQVAMGQLGRDNKPTLFISYEPYATGLEKKGYMRISSTRELSKMQVIDAIFIDERVVSPDASEVRKLKEAFDRAVKSLQADPKEFYETIKGYMENQTYDEFMRSLGGIEWLNQNPPNGVIEHLKQQNIAVDKLIR